VRDLPQSRDLLALARELLLDELLPLLPPERERDAHLIATAMAIAGRETAGAGAGWQNGVLRSLQEFYGKAAPHPARGERGNVGASSPRPVYREREGPAQRAGKEGSIERLHPLRRFAADLRNGAFETSPSRAAAARAILWRLTVEKLREGNPHFLAANGFPRAGATGE
jgi:hypothetical protein